MREKWFALLLAGALTLSFAACAAVGEGPDPGPSPTPPAETVPASPDPSMPAPPVISLPPEGTASHGSSEGAGGVIPDTELPQRDYRPWQTVYMEFLAVLLRAEEETGDREAAFGGLAADNRGITAGWSLYEEPPLPLTQVMEMGSESYSLYDVDGDGVPELFVQYGNCEAAYTTQCYTFRDGQIVCIGEFRSGHSSLYTDPDQSAVVRHEGHMGYAEIYEYPMEGGKLTGERVLFTEEDVWDYTQVDEIVPGAEYIQTFYTRRGMEDDSYWTGQVPYSLGKALVLPIADWYDGPAATGDSSETARTAILAVLNGEGELYGASGDHFYGDVGWMTWEEYIQPGAAYPYNDVPFTVQTHVWQDMNGDGQEECVIQLMTEDEEQNTLTVVLSEQDGAVYAYAFGFLDLSYDTISVGYPCQSELYTNGVLQSQYGGVTALSFWKGQCYQYAVQREASAQPVKWVDGSPAG